MVIWVAAILVWLLLKLLLLLYAGLFRLTEAHTGEWGSEN